MKIPKNETKQWVPRKLDEKFTYKIITSNNREYLTDDLEVWEYIEDEENFFNGGMDNFQILTCYCFIDNNFHKVYIRYSDIVTVIKMEPNYDDEYYIDLFA